MIEKSIILQQNNKLAEGLDSIMDYIKALLNNYGVKENIAGYLAIGIIVLMILLACIIVNLILNKIVLRIMTRIIKSNRFAWDDIFLKKRVIHRIFSLVPGIIVYISAPAFDNSKVTTAINRLATTYIWLVTAFVINALLDAINEIYSRRPISKTRPIKGLLQVIKIAFYIILAIVIIANLMGRDPLLILSGIGALAAVFSFVFKDSILGFIAGIQLTSNDMLRIGDWIEMSKYGADGDVIDITLNTVKVQNFDKSIVTIPAYSLISDSFKNWRGMVEFGGRRIKRSVYIDVNSIGFCTQQMLEKFKKVNYLKDFIIEKEKELKTYNTKNKADNELLINGRHLTNLGIFRVYISYYLKHHRDIDNNQSQVVRQLPPGEFGLPIEVYAFTVNTDWESYEETLADIFDHIFSVAGEFGLRIFQNPTGHDMKSINHDALTNSKESHEA